jgi:hypothetical protein
MGPIRCPETSVKVYHSTLRNTPEERRSHVLFFLGRFCHWDKVTLMRYHYILEDVLILKIICRTFKKSLCPWLYLCAFCDMTRVHIISQPSMAINVRLRLTVADTSNYSTGRCLIALGRMKDSTLVRPWIMRWQSLSGDLPRHLRSKQLSVLSEEMRLFSRKCDFPRSHQPISQTVTHSAVNASLI